MIQRSGSKVPHYFFSYAGNHSLDIHPDGARPTHGIHHQVVCMRQVEGHVSLRQPGLPVSIGVEHQLVRRPHQVPRQDCSESPPREDITVAIPRRAKLPGLGEFFPAQGLLAARQLTHGTTQVKPP
jgi:hypothetical protein